MILVNNTLVQGQHDFYKRVGITLSEENNEEENPSENSGSGQNGGGNDQNQNPVLEPTEPTENGGN